MAGKKRKAEAARLEETDRALYGAFRGAANSLSQLYTLAMGAQKVSFHAGERHAMVRLQPPAQRSAISSPLPLRGWLGSSPGSGGAGGRDLFASRRTDPHPVWAAWDSAAVVVVRIRAFRRDRFAISAPRGRFDSLAPLVITDSDCCLPWHHAKTVLRSDATPY
jgi:hypothetical protein